MKRRTKLSTKIERDFSFCAASHFEGTFMINVFTLSLEMMVETESIREQNIAMERIKYLIYTQLTDCIFVQDTEETAIDQYMNAGMKVCVLPEEPYDQIITLVLLMKLNAITENRLKITKILLGSELSDDVKFIYEDSVLSLPSNLQKDGWWTISSPKVMESPKSNKKAKIVRLVGTADWTKLGLTWQEPAPNAFKTADIIFTSDLEK